MTKTVVTKAATSKDADGRSGALDDLLCFDLYAASRAVTAFYRPLLDELGLTYPQYLVLVLLHSDGTRTVSELARDLRLDHGTLTPLLRRLDTAGLLTRTRRAADERVVEVAITTSGEDLHARFDDVQCRVREAIGISEPAVRALQATLQHLTASVAQL